jgi:hypothetical protein
MDLIRHLVLAGIPSGQGFVNENGRFRHRLCDSALPSLKSRAQYRSTYGKSPNL